MAMTKLRCVSLGLGLAAVPALLAIPATVRTAETPANPAAAPAEKGVVPEADRVLRRMAEYVASLQSFTVHSSAVDEVVLDSGQKLQISSDSAVSVTRPNRLRSEQLGPGAGMAFWYDGKSMTLYCKPTNSYATTPAPSTLDATIDLGRKRFQIEAPAADLLFSRPYDVLTEQVTGGRLVGRETVNGVGATHLAFDGEEVDWQVWVQDGANPLPLRFEITTKTMKAQPEFTARLSRWDTQAKLADSTFSFQPPAGAKRVDSFPTSCHTSP
jgi:hypothetical protein